MARYSIADETIEFTAKNKENGLRFKKFLTTTESSEIILQIEDECLNAFQRQHGNLSMAQCELILSMRSFLISL